MICAFLTVIFELKFFFKLTIILGCSLQIGINLPQLDFKPTFRVILFYIFAHVLCLSDLTSK